jgi:cation transport regulator ChaC
VKRAEDDIWLFGYASLVWRPDFAFEEATPARVHGWVRRFYQGSVDHRGVPGAPGRVATLLPEPRGRCMGVAYRVSRSRAPSVLDALDRREVGGYARLELDAHVPGRTGPAPRVVTYVATPDNEHYLGHAPVEQMARQVLRSEGPSGHNVEYVLRLERWLRAQGEDDPHVRELAAHVRRRLGR